MSWRRIRVRISSAMAEIFWAEILRGWLGLRAVTTQFSPANVARATADLARKIKRESRWRHRAGVRAKAEDEFSGQRRGAHPAPEWSAARRDRAPLRSVWVRWG